MRAWATWAALSGAALGVGATAAGASWGLAVYVGCGLAVVVLAMGDHDDRM